MTTALSRKAGQEAKLLAAAKDVEARRNEAKLQLMALAPKVRLACKCSNLRVPGVLQACHDQGGASCHGMLVCLRARKPSPEGTRDL